MADDTKVVHTVEFKSKGQKKLLKETQALTKEVEDLTKQEALLNKELEKLEKGSDGYIKKTVELQAVQEKMKKSTDKLTKSYTDLSKKSLKGVDKLKKGFDKLSKSGKKLGNGLKKAGKVGVGAMALLGAGLLAVKSAMATSEDGADGLSKTLAGFEGLIRPLMKTIGEFGTTLLNEPTKAFTGLVKGWEAFKQSYIQPFILGFDNMVLKIQMFGLNVKKSFDELKSFVGMDTDIKGINDEINNLTTQIDDNNKKLETGKTAWSLYLKSIVDGVKGLIKDGKATSKQYQELEELRQRLEKSRRVEEVQNAKILAQIEKEKRIRDDQSLTLKEREDANNRIASLETKRFNSMQQQLKDELKLLEKTADLKGRTPEMLDIIKDKEIELADLVSQSETIKVEQTTNSVALRLEENDKYISQLDADVEALNVLTDKETDRIEREISANIEKTAKLIELGLEENQAFQDNANERVILDAQLKKALQDQEDEANAKKKAGNDKANDDELKNAKLVKEVKDALLKNWISNVDNGFKLLASLDEENKQLQAASLIASGAAGIANTIISTIVGNAKITEQFGVLGAPLVVANTIAGGIGVASIIAETAKGVSALGGGGGVSGGIDAQASASSVPDSQTLFSQQDLPGAEVESIGGGAGKNQNGQRVYVVESDITDTQKKVRSIESRSQIK